MTNTELARSYYRIFKGLTLLFLLIAAPVLIYSIVAFSAIFSGRISRDVISSFVSFGAFFALLLSGGFAFALALYFEKYIKENEGKEEVTKE